MTDFINYYLHPTENSRVKTIKAYFINYNPYLTESSRICVCNIC